jgi:TatD DNase family protein
MPDLVDSHCHLNFSELGPQCDDVVVRARNAGVRRMVSISTTMDEFEAVKATAHKYDEIYCSIGVHPHVAIEPIEVETLVDKASDPKVVGIGETGFDYFYDKSPREAQELCFRKHIRAAMETGLPLIVHTRDAEADTIRVIREETSNGASKLSGVIHCYSSRRVLAEEALEMGFYISLSGILTFKNAQDIRDTVAQVPMDRLLVETDSPYLAPVPYRGKPCEPAYVVETAKALAVVKGVSFDEMAAATTRNFFTLFSKVRPL